MKIGAWSNIKRSAFSALSAQFSFSFSFSFFSSVVQSFKFQCLFFLVYEATLGRPRSTSSAWRNSARPRSPSGGRTSTPPTTEEIRQCTGSPGTAPTRHTDANPFADPGRTGGWNETPPQTKSSSNSIMNCFQHTPESCGALHNPCGGAPHKETISPQTRPNRLHNPSQPIQAPCTSALAPHLPVFA